MISLKEMKARLNHLLTYLFLVSWIFTAPESCSSSGQSWPQLWLDLQYLSSQGERVCQDLLLALLCFYPLFVSFSSYSTLPSASLSVCGAATVSTGQCRRTTTWSTKWCSRRTASSPRLRTKYHGQSSSTGESKNDCNCMFLEPWYVVCTITEITRR